MDNHKEQIITNLIRIEDVLARLYTRFSKKSDFTAPVKKFWATIAGEEKLHSNIMDKVCQAVREEKATVSVDLRIERLKEFISKLNEILKKASSENLSEAEAYSIGAKIEVELDEESFTGLIHTTDEKLDKLLKLIKNDTKKHRVMLVNYSRGIR